MTPIAEALKPYTLYLIYAQILLLSLAIFVGAMLIIRRLWRREPVDGGIIQDREKLASEIHEEILRLQDLRNRLDSSYIIEGKDIAASPIPRVLGSEAGGASAGPTANALSQLDLEAKVHEATQFLTNEVAVLTDKLVKAEEKLKQAAHVAPPMIAAVSADQEKMTVEIRDLKEKLEDYQAFEDEIALVKQYKEEIERLKAQLGAPSDNIGINEDDIASLFAEMGSVSSQGDEENSSAFSDASAEPELTQTFKADAIDETFEQLISAEDKPSEEDPFKALLSESEELAADPEDAPPSPGYVAEAKSEEPSMPPVNEDNAEALAELGDDDSLMAEFEKVLNTKDSEKNS